MVQRIRAWISGTGIVAVLIIRIFLNKLMFLKKGNVAYSGGVIIDCFGCSWNYWYFKRLIDNISKIWDKNINFFIALLTIYR